MLWNALALSHRAQNAKNSEVCRVGKDVKQWGSQLLLTEVSIGSTAWRAFGNYLGWLVTGSEEEWARVLTDGEHKKWADIPNKIVKWHHSASIFPDVLRNLTTKVRKVDHDRK